MGLSQDGVGCFGAGEAGRFDVDEQVEAALRGIDDAEALAFAEANNFPIFAMEKDLWFEKITFEIMYAVQFDDRVYLSEEKIDSMLSGSMNRSELDIILKGISLKL